jgi:peptidoglycan/LPS O-acetylase OafA/YrhL
MYHQAISGLIHGLLGDGVPSVDTLAGCARTLLALVLTLIVAAVSFRWFERPLLELGHRFKYQDTVNDYEAGTRSEKKN